MIKYLISVKSLMSHTMQLFSFENSGCSLISNHASAQSNLGYCYLHTQHMNMIACMHRVRLNRFRATCPKHCYMIIVQSYMTEKNVDSDLKHKCTYKENEIQSN